MGKKLGQSIGWLEQEISTRPKTIVHADLREDNLLFGKPGTEEAVLIIDWQLAIRSIGAFDVARLMGGSEIPKERKGHHLRVLRRWYDHLINEGVEGYSWEEAIHDFKLAALSCIILPVHIHDLMIGVKGRKRDLFKALTSRHFSSAVELDAQSVLP